MKRVSQMIAAGILISSAILMNGCQEANETVDKVTKDVTEVIQVESTKNNEYVVSVKTGHFFNYPEYEVGEAFDVYFGNPKWKYFESDDGEHVVEFTGNAVYRDADVKATLQFVVDEGEDDDLLFETVFLDFNGVPQTDLIQAALLESVFEDMEAGADFPDETEVSLDYEEESPFERMLDSYLVELDTDTIGQIFNEELFENPDWEIEGDSYFVFTGNYRAELIEGEPSYLQFDIIETADGQFEIERLTFNGEEVGEEGFEYIIELLDNAAANVF